MVRAPSDGKTTGDSSQLSSPKDDVALLVQSDLLLSSLTKQAAVARVEAQKAELELLLTKARAGETDALRRWMAAHSESAEDTLPASVAGEIGRSQTTPGMGGWADFLDHSRKRLKQFAIERTAMELPSQSEPDPCAANEDGRWDLLGSATPELLRKRPQELPEGNKPERVSVASESKVKKPAIDPDRLGLLVESGRASEEEQEERSQLRVLLSRVGGVGASVLAHVALIIVLAIVTLKMPSDAASLGLQASASTELEEPFEISESAEPEVPETNMEQTQPTEQTIDVAEQLDGLESSLADSLSSLAPKVSLASAKNGMSSAAKAMSGPASTSASFFGAAASGNCFCYVIDGSGSMRGGPWEAAKFELLKSLASLKPKQRFYIIFFNRKLTAITLPGKMGPSPRALYATPENLEHARRWVDTLEIGIGAPPNKALEFAIEKEPDAIYLLTDGVTTVDVAKFLRETNRVEDLLGAPQVLVPIHSIAFYSLEGQQLLQQIANENRGQFIYVPDPRRR